MVSVIIPTYNYAAWLPQTIASLQQQSYSDWECIIIDDGSTDDTAQALEPLLLSDTRIRYIQQTNQGVSAARNRGLQEAKGQYIQFLDGDDLLQPDKLKTHVAYLEGHPDVDLVYGEVRFFRDNNPQQLQTSLYGDKPDNWMPQLQGKGSHIIASLSRFNFLVIHAPLFRQRVLALVSGFDQRMTALEDWDFWMRCALENFVFHFHSAPEAFALVRGHEGSLSTQKKHMQSGHFRFLKKCLTHPALKPQFRLLLLIKFVELFWNTLFSEQRIGTTSVFWVTLCLLFLPVYLLIKIIRLVTAIKP